MPPGNDVIWFMGKGGFAFVDEAVLTTLPRTLANLPSERNRDSLSHGRFTPRTLALSRRNKLSA